ncbi:hypothetical protein AB1Y20_013625 [Prymnesium parvum]|uniref:DUF2470 domain-containing protein n=1 Tax=Prymnesium parvum TaxID=97485 RepID=A0AB34IFM9_PRYPA
MAEVQHRHAAALLALSREDAATLDVKHVRVTKLDLSALHASYTTCAASLCQTHALVVPFDPPLDQPADVHRRLAALLSSRVMAPCRLLVAQPLALLALAGMTLLPFACWSDSQAAELLLLPLGGSKDLGVRIFACAVLAHVCEAMVALRICQQLRMGSWPTAAWGALVFVFGYPCLRWLLPMRPLRTSVGKYK